MSPSNVRGDAPILSASAKQRDAIDGALILLDQIQAVQALHRDQLDASPQEPTASAVLTLIGVVIQRLQEATE